MKIFFCTDLHGYKKKYEKVLEIQDQFDLIIVGSDILPKDGHYHQEKFIREYLPDFFLRVKKNLIIDFGNDDHAAYYGMFKQMIENHNKKYYEHVFVTHYNEVIIDDISFLGMDFVPDYPFGLKDWCRIDNNRIDPVQYGPCTSTIDGYRNIDDLVKYYNDRPSIKQCLKLLPKPSKEKHIYLFHSPPRNIKLDVCCNRKEVGSQDITDFISNCNALVSLHGHIHESPNMTGRFYGQLNEKTISIQPGQSYYSKDLTYCSFDTDNIVETIKLETI